MDVFTHNINSLPTFSYKNRTERGYLAFYFDPVGRHHIFPSRAPHLLMRLWRWGGEGCTTCLQRQQKLRQTQNTKHQIERRLCCVLLNCKAKSVNTLASYAKDRLAVSSNRHKSEFQRLKAPAMSCCTFVSRMDGLKLSAH